MDSILSLAWWFKAIAGLLVAVLGTAGGAVGGLLGGSATSAVVGVVSGVGLAVVIGGIMASRLRTLFPRGALVTVVGSNGYGNSVKVGPNQQNGGTGSQDAGEVKETEIPQDVINSEARESTTAVPLETTNSERFEADYNGSLVGIKRGSLQISEWPDVVKDKIFSDCTIDGPGALVLVPVPVIYMQSPTLEYVGFLPVNDPDMLNDGVVRIENCQFIRCRFRNVLFIGHHHILDNIRRASVHTTSRSPGAAPDLSPTTKKQELVYEQRGRIRRVIYAEYSDSVIFMPVVAIHNSGAPTTIEWVEISLVLASGDTVTCQPCVIVEPFEIPNEKGDLTLTVSPSDMIASKTAETPIPSGGSCTGYLLFRASGVRPKDAVAPETEVRIVFEDVERNRRYINKRIGKPSNQLLAFPGLPGVKPSTPDTATPPGPESKGEHPET